MWFPGSVVPRLEMATKCAMTQLVIQTPWKSQWTTSPLTINYIIVTCRIFLIFEFQKHTFILYTTPLGYMYRIAPCIQLVGKTVFTDVVTAETTHNFDVSCSEIFYRHSCGDHVKGFLFFHATTDDTEDGTGWIGTKIKINTLVPFQLQPRLPVLCWILSNMHSLGLNQHARMLS